MNIKDVFSKNAIAYNQFRPLYPKELYEFVLQNVKKRESALDVATGNGQVARHLSGYFKNVVATDISQKQLDEAIDIPNVEYVQSPAEKMPFTNNSFDLITVAQAIHWFNFNEFIEEIERITKPKGTIAIWGYGTIRINNALNEVLDHFYHEVVGKYWDKARKHVETHYRSIPFPFDDMKSANFENKLDWTAEHFLGYLGTWTSVRQYREARNEDPVTLIEEEVKSLWGPDERTIVFPLFCKTGKV